MIIWANSGQVKLNILIYILDLTGIYSKKEHFFWGDALKKLGRLCYTIGRNRIITVQFSGAMPLYFRRKWPLVSFQANLPIFFFFTKKRKNYINKGLLFTIISIILLRTTTSGNDHTLFISIYFIDIPNYLLVGFLINSAREDTSLQD